MANALATTTAITVNGTDTTNTTETNATSVSTSTTSGSTSIGGSSSTSLSTEQASHTTSINGTQTNISVSRNDTSPSGTVSSGNTSVSTSSLNTISSSAISSTTTTSINGSKTTTGASADGLCLRLAVSSGQSTSSTICLSVSPNNGGSASASATATSGSTTVGGSTSTGDIIPKNPLPPISPSLFSVTKTKSGLVQLDPLSNETKTSQELEANQNYWHYGGSAFSYFNPPAPTDLFKDSQGLHLGVQTPTAGQYAGYYAVAPLTNATLFHAKISTPVQTIDSEFFQNGLYVQTGNGLINYVTCVSITSTAGTSWHIIRTFGDINEATQFEQLWDDWSAGQPLSRDCTIITNGSNYLKVYLDGVKVYENNAIDLQMPGPFLYFLEPQNSHAQMLYGIYNDYYTTKGEAIKVTDIPPTASRVDVVDASGAVLATSPVSDGIATLDVGMYHFPLAASIKVYGSDNIEMASGSADIFGGDTYAIKLNPKI